MTFGIIADDFLLRFCLYFYLFSISVLFGQNFQCVAHELLLFDYLLSIPREQEQYNLYKWKHIAHDAQ